MLGLSTSSSPGTKPMRSIINAGRKLWLKFRRSDNISRERLSNANFEDNEPAAGNDFLSGGLQFNNWIENQNSGLRRFTKIPGGIRCDILEPADNTWHNRIYSDVLNSSLTENQTYRFTAEVRCSVDGNFNASIEATNGDDPQPHPDVQTAVTNSEFSLVNTTFNYIPDSDGENGVSNIVVHLYPNIVLPAGSFYEVRNVSLKEISQFELDASSESNDAKLFTGKALSFDGTNDYVALPATLEETVWTCAMWLGDYTEGSFDFIIGEDSNSNIGLQNDQDATGKIFFRANNSDYYDFDSNITTFTGYKRFVWTSDGTNVYLYIDGVFISNATNAEGEIPSDTTLEVKQIMAGYSTGGSNNHLVQGKASDFQFYDSCWTANDAYLDYTYPNELLIDAGGSVARNSLRVHLPMSEGSGAVAFNSVRLGEELITNTDFSTGGAITTTSYDLGWRVINANNEGGSISGGALTLNYTSGQESDEARVYATVSTSTFVKPSDHAGKKYRLEYEIVAITGSPKLYYYNGGYILGSSTLGIKTVYFTSQTNRLVILKNAAENSSVTIDNISLREVVTPFDSIYNGAALGATWVTAQPTIPQLGMQDWSKGSNLFPTSESSLSLTNVTSSAVEGPAVNSADALNTATRLTETTANGQHYSSAVFVAYSGIEYTLSVFVKKGTYDQIRLVTSSSVIASEIFFTFSTEAFTATTFSPAAEDYGNGWYRVSWTGTAKTDFGASSNCSLYISPLNLSSYAGATSKYTDFFGWQVEIGDTMGNYIPTNGLLAQDATLTANPYNAGYDVVGNALRTRNKSLNLNGIGYAEIADDDTLDFGTGDFTMECWVKYKFEHTGSAVNCIIALGGDAANASASLLTSSTTFRVYVGSGFVNSTYTLVEDNWYHVVGTRTGTTIRLYINGEVESSTGTSNQSLTNALVKFVGVDTNTTTRTYKSAINEVRVYNRALSLTEITNNYKVGKSKHSN